MASFAFARKRKETELSKQGGEAIPPGLLRLKKDFEELDLPRTMKMNMNPDDISTFTVDLVPAEGPWRGGLFVFKFTVNTMSYPHEPPVALCLTQVYHPNINKEGKICLNVLRDDWKPFYTITTVLQSLQLLFTELVNPDDPLNKEAAALMKQNERRFDSVVRDTIRGGISVDGVMYRGNLAR
uniref:NEDD8 carrier protein n=2 Tax=Rhodosorus marinus TaxID=101924 RepID=A0A7S3E664_9RHOD|mmetsp:Transcript_11081/g.46254  ORF Transcript_11081/g.46254 Transcript_11081/m.46254 type:complete len:183 (+) Transcript_11081:244-792(+)|eukprot:CAMPEP_0113971910 /NCGR_PEP_ID=MMETSP0011_2-20120614/12758_1 /TAXON_ID=101924 /ORGANISM="Rhodosorus marinus" /LENGTH=182 /DNA_ID=CAMNT_0000987977 /DNA_START=173 /DNA_END=721 /DNA_ORIENTATION=- /assembly_acc=CAM_ASM_000156